MTHPAIYASCTETEAQGLPCNLDRANERIEEAVERGNVDAMVDVGMLLNNGADRVAEDVI